MDFITACKRFPKAAAAGFSTAFAGVRRGLAPTVVTLGELPSVRIYAPNEVCCIPPECWNAFCETDALNQSEHVPFLHPQRFLGVHPEEPVVGMVGRNFCDSNSRLFCDECVRLLDGVV